MKKKKGKLIVKGTFNASSRGYGFLKPENTELDEIFISPKNVGLALNGDIVEAEVIKGKFSDRKAEGKIVKIINHSTETVVGLFQKSRSFGFVVPDDKKFGTDIFISKKKWGEAKNNQKVVVKILKYPTKGKNAEGEVIEVLGDINQAGIDMLSLIKEYSLPYEFPEFVQSEVKKINQEVSEKEYKHRRILTDEVIFTIDGEDAKDLDDAVAVKKLSNGNYKLDVHIADVSNYVKEDTKLDKEAILRGTSIYMFDRVIPMLPFELSNGICSLNAGVDRCTLSVSMEINKKGQVVSSEVYKAIIKVTERMNYTDVNKIITGSDDEVLKRYSKYIDNFKLMEELALILKNRRLKQGYLNLDIPESKIILDKKGKAIDVKKYESTFANEIIEQFMLTANETIAEKFYWLESPFIYRVHEEPDYDKIKETNKFIWNLGYKIKANKDNIHPKAFAEILDDVKGKEEEKVVANIILRTLRVAKYEAENKGHFGIASKYYCHFTSPIRRYPDLFIHRVISDYLKSNYNIDENKKTDYKAKSEQYAESSSEREKIATKVEREAEDIKKAEYMEDKIGNEYEGIISSITSFGMFVELENTIEGLIRFENMGDDYYIYDEERKTLIGEHTNKIFKIGDKVKIAVVEANKELRKIAFELLDDEELTEDNE